MNPAAALMAVVIVGAAWWWTRQNVDPQSGETDNAPDPIDYVNQVTESASNMVEANPTQDTAAANLAAFLLAIRAHESRQDDAGYREQFGGSYFDDFTDHPALLGWPGVGLSDTQCAGAGFGPGCVSTAAGAYQFTRPTWKRLKASLGLPDFSPASQDAAAIELIREKGALDDVYAGRAEVAAGKVRKVWASLPGAGYAGQASQSMTAFLDQYTNNGGAIA